VFAQLLKPFSWLYGGITDIRNGLYDSGISDALKPSIYTVSVGNLTVGGTGKTPHVDYLLHHLPQSVAVATLSRGYGRRTRGFRIATAADTADTIGDEPLLLYRKHAPRVTVSVGEKRAEAVPKLLEAVPHLRMLVLDDAFQHRPVQPHLNILLTDYNRPFYTDHPFPAGRLRERRHGARRAQLVVVTKCPDNLPEAEQEQIRQSIRPYTAPQTPVFFTGLTYGDPVAFTDGAIRSSAELGEVLLVSGIARPEPLEQYGQSQLALAGHLRFADHHRYTAADLDRIRAARPAGGSVITTEKDFVKLGPLLAQAGEDASRFYYLPIQIRFLSGEDHFLERLFSAARDGMPFLK